MRKATVSQIKYRLGAVHTTVNDVIHINSSFFYSLDYSSFLKLLEAQEKEVNEFVEQERRGLVNTTKDLERQVWISQ